MLKPKNKDKNKKRGELRRSQLVTTFGCGAIVDLPDISGIISGIDNWNINCKEDFEYRILKIREPNLSKMLGKKFFIQPVSAGDKVNDGYFGIPIFRFPYYYYCPNCGRLDKYLEISKSGSGKLYCNNCGTQLVPSRFLAACPNGHLEDFPYGKWVHRRKHPECTNHRLTLKYKSETAGLDGIIIACETCGAWESMAGCMNEGALKQFGKCKGNMPWIDGNNYKTSQKEKCNADLRTLQRTANNVYYSVNVSALTIPPWSEDINYFLQNNKDNIDMMKQSGPNWLNVFYSMQNIKNKFGLSIEMLKKAIEKCFSDEGDTPTEKDLIKNEYYALCMPDVNHKYFKTVKETVPEEYSEYIEEIKLVKRLREVQVLKGFRRIFPEIEHSEETINKLGLMDREFTPLSLNPNIEWLPAVELFGEGIFIKLRKETVQKWVSEVENRYEDMGKRMPFDIANGMFSSQYVLLHTLSHLLIRQLAYTCGYNTTSLKEKIYSTFRDDENDEMFGILIYTAATDCDGSLGGLVREGKQENLKKLIDEMLQTAYWCSNDPICIESKSQGFNSLNYAACHACTLLPETSCVSRNCLLDRAAIIGEPDNRNIAFFKDKVS